MLKLNINTKSVSLLKKDKSVVFVNISSNNKSMNVLSLLRLSDSISSSKHYVST